MDCPKFIVSNQKKESISIQRVKDCYSVRGDIYKHKIYLQTVVVLSPVKDVQGPVSETTHNALE